MYIILILLNSENDIFASQININCVCLSKRFIIKVDTIIIKYHFSEVLSCVKIFWQYIHVNS